MFEYFDMGEHTFYVWLAYGVSVFALVFLGVLSIKSKTAAKMKVRKKIDRLTKLKASKALEPKT